VHITSRYCPQFTSVENLEDISEPQVSPQEQKDPYIKFSIGLLSFEWEKVISPIETNYKH